MAEQWSADVEPVADLEAVAVDRERLAGEGVVDHQGDELFGELIRAVVVGAVGDERGQAIGVVPGADEVVGRGFGRGVGAVGGVGGVFMKGGVVGGERAVDLVSRDVKEAELLLFRAGERGEVMAGGLQEDEGAVDVGAEEGFGAGDGAVHVAFRGRSGGWPRGGAPRTVGRQAWRRRCRHGRRCSCGLSSSEARLAALPA